MDQIEIKNKIAEYYAKLPPKAQEVFADMQWINILKTLSKKYNLNEDQISTLGTETTLVLLSLVNKDDYKKLLIDEIKISQIQMIGLVKDIEDLILNPISKLLDEAYTINAQAFDGEDRDTLDERFDRMPENVKRAIIQSDYRKKLYEISIKYKLPVDKMGVLEDTTVDLIVGKIAPSQYENKLSLVSDIDANTSHDIANDVNENIMKVVRDAMKKQDEIKKDILQDDEVPIPPYKKDTEDVILSHTENSVMKDSGVDLNIDSIDTKDDIIQEIQKEEVKIGGVSDNQNTEPSIGSIIGHKLNTITNTQATTTVHNLDKKTEVKIPETVKMETKKSIDPYHEVIE